MSVGKLEQINLAGYGFRLNMAQLNAAFLIVVTRSEYLFEHVVGHGNDCAGVLGGGVELNAG